MHFFFFIQAALIYLGVGSWEISLKVYFGKKKTWINKELLLVSVHNDIQYTYGTLQISKQISIIYRLLSLQKLHIRPAEGTQKRGWVIFIKP